ncbi:MAG: cysteine hydrolase family protein [bacterium]
MVELKSESNMRPYVTADTIDEKSDGWLKEIAPFNRHPIRLRAEKSALLVVDMQNFFLDPESPTFTDGGPAVLPNAKRLITAFRDAGRPVIFTKHVHHPNMMDIGIMGWWWDGACIEGTPESEIHADILPEEGEKIILKHRYSAFYNTDLETILRCCGIEDLAICGIMTNMCCESTARDAYYRDYRVFFPADATAAVCEKMHVASLLNLAYGFANIVKTCGIIEGLK